MERESVNSTNIDEIGFDPDNDVLEILFKNGRLYQYLNVPAFVYEQLRHASSIGKYFNAEIKGRYPEVRM